jgi:hypothetical protein
MKRSLLIASVILGGAALAASAAVAPPKAAMAAAGDAPNVRQPLSPLLGADLRFGMTHIQVINAHTKVNGIIDQEYAPALARLQPGVRMQSLEAERDNRKVAFDHSFIRFGDTPTGFDASPIKSEYSYRNHESIQQLNRQNGRRFFFYFGDPPATRLWKIYDEVSLRDGGPYGATFHEAVAKINQQFGGTGRTRPVDAANGIDYPTVDWQDQYTHLRLIDRSREQIVGIVVEERATLNNLATLRANKPIDRFALDPSIAALTKNGVSDPNAANAAASANPPSGKNPPPKKKK